MLDSLISDSMRLIKERHHVNEDRFLKEEVFVQIDCSKLISRTT